MKRFKYGLLVFVFATLLFVSILGAITGTEQKTFSSFLLMLQDVPEFMPIENIQSYFSLGGFMPNLPDYLSFLRGLFSFIDTIIMLFSFVLKGLIDVCLYAFYIVRWLYI